MPGFMQSSWRKEIIMPGNPAKTILIVEDDRPTQRLLETLMRRHGYASLIAANGREAIDVLRAREVHAIILDLMMPEVDGRGVLDFLSAEGRRTPIVVCTAAGTRVTDSLKSDLVKAVVRKPFDVTHLAEIVATLVSGG